MEYLIRYCDGVEEVVEASDIDEAKQLARAALREGDWQGEETVWPSATIYSMNADGEWEEAAEVRVAIHPQPPPCAEDEDGEELAHEWAGEDMQVNGGGVVVTEVCHHCGTIRERDTWSDGTRRESITYRESDAETLRRFREEGSKAADGAELAAEPPAHLGALAREAYRWRMEERLRKAYAYVRERVLDSNASEDDGPEDYAEAADWFAAVFRRRPDREDGDHLALWSQVVTHFTR
jgi:hypothetical protein